MLGLEAASFFAIFTSQVWDMTFSFYASLVTLPRELKEATAIGRGRFAELFEHDATAGVLSKGPLAPATHESP